MIRLNVFIEVGKEDRAKYIELAKQLVAETVKEEGCIAYDLYESSTRENVLMICETWENAETLAAHTKSAHFTSLVPQMEAMAKLKIEKFEF